MLGLYFQIERNQSNIKYTGYQVMNNKIIPIILPKTTGIINFFNALLSNNIPHAPYSYLLYAHILLNKVNFIFWKSKKTSQMRSKNKLLV